MNKWKNSLDFQEQFQDDDCFSCEFGKCKIRLSDIIALSRQYDEIINDRNMVSLRKKVQENGWKDPHPHTLHLIRLIDGKFIVGDGGGNHRVVLAEELGMEEVEGHVTVRVPINLVSDDVQKKIVAYETEDIILRNLSKREHTLRGKEKIWKRLEWLEENKQQMLRSVIKSLGWL